MKCLKLVVLVAALLLMSLLMGGCPDGGLLPLLTSGNGFDHQYVSPNIGTLKYVPAGRFQRDSTVTNISVVSAFRMSRHEITRAQFLAIMGTDPSGQDYSSSTSDPVQRVNWYHAIAFCNKLSLAEGLTQVYSVTVSGTEVDWENLAFDDIPIINDLDWNDATANWGANGYRLPTEMEWMWAAMGAPADGQGGDTNTAGYLKGYAGSTEGDGQTNIGNYAWYTVNSAGTTHPAGDRTENELGLYDMSGNVWEWCWDRHAEPYPDAVLENYRGADLGTGRVRRGGSWDVIASSCTVANRDSFNPRWQFSSMGFRVVRP